MSDLVLRGTVIAGGRRIDDGIVAVTGDRIGWVGPTADWTGAGTPPPPSDRLLLPGLVDVHCHGGAGHGFPEADAAGAREAVAHHRAHGTTTQLASLVSAPPAELARRVATLAPLVADGLLAGVHLEGPFLAATRCGAQDPAAIRPGDPRGAARGARHGARRGRHDDPRPGDRALRRPARGARRARRRPEPGPHRRHRRGDHRGGPGGPRRHRGAAVSATHLFNAMPPLHHRAPGPVAACLAAAARGEMVLELVADGVHLADDTVATVFDLVGPGRIALVTDAMAAAGMPDGDYPLGSMPVAVRGGVARLRTPEGPGAIAGGTAHMVDLVRRAVHHAGVDLRAAVTAASATPAALLGLAHEVGDLRPGLRADVLVTDPDLDPVAVLAAGAWVPRPTLVHS